MRRNFCRHHTWMVEVELSPTVDSNTNSTKSKYFMHELIKHSTVCYTGIPWRRRPNIRVGKNNAINQPHSFELLKPKQIINLLQQRDWTLSRRHLASKSSCSHPNERNPSQEEFWKAPLSGRSAGTRPKLLTLLSFAVIFHVHLKT